MASELVVYAAHDFQAENPDELSFFAGEKIVVLEKDELYGDGWWQGKNPRGDIGLFPQSYTSETPPTAEEMAAQQQSSAPPAATAAAAPSSGNDVATNGSSAAADPAKATTIPGEAAQEHKLVRENSISSKASDAEDDNLPVVANPRALLAQKAAENAQREEDKQHAEQERMRKEDEQAYERAKRDAGLDDLQLSDESDDELPPGSSFLSPPGAANGLSSSTTTVRERRDTSSSAYTEPAQPADIEDTSAEQLVPTPAVVPDSAQSPTSAATTRAIEPASGSTSNFPVAETLAAAGVGAGAGAAALGVAHLFSEDRSAAQHAPAAQAATQPLSTSAARAAPVPINTARTASPTQSPLTSPPTSARRTAGTETPEPGRRASVTADLPYDPSTWNVEQVIIWAQSKGFDQLTIDKFQEHEISGDVLLEMDVAMLKEIDLVAFGRRMHIYNGIKELKARTTSSYPASDTASVPASPAASPSLARSDAHLQGLGYPSQYVPGPDRRVSSGSLRSAAHMRQASAVSQPIPESDEAVVDPLTEAESRTEKTTVFPTGKSPRAEAGSEPLGVSRDSGPPSSASVKSGKSGSSDVGSSATSKKSKERSFFTVTGIGRSRKPAPSVPSSLLSSSTRSNASSGSSLPASQSKGSRLSVNTSTKRSTRLFGAFSPSVDKGSSTFQDTQRSPTLLQSGQTPRQTSNSSMMPKEVDTATDEMVAKSTKPISSEGLLEKIGTPDHSGWLKKRGQNGLTWKPRFFVLKGNHLYYLKSENERKAKGFVDLSNYKVFADATIKPGEFGFRLEPKASGSVAHFFAAAESVTVRNWMKEIMKATIRRDYSSAALSSSNIETVPLAMARAMKPRPPSPTSRARAQRQRYAGNNPNTLTPKDAAILMEFAPANDAPARSNTTTGPTAGKRTSSVYSTPTSPVLGTKGSPDRPKQSSARTAQKTSTASSASALAATAASPSVVQDVKSPNLRQKVAAFETSYPDLVAWVNKSLPAGESKVSDVGPALRSGRVLVRVAESISKKDSQISDAEFDKWHPPSEGADMFDPAYFDVVFSVFDYLTTLVSTEDVSMEDMLSGNEERLAVLVERLRTTFA